MIAELGSDFVLEVRKPLDSYRYNALGIDVWIVTGGERVNSVHIFAPNTKD